MVKVFQWVNAVVLCLLAFALGLEVLTQIWPGDVLVPRAQGEETGGAGQIYLDRQPKAIDDPVEIVKVTEGGKMVVPGVYRVLPYETLGQPIPAGGDWIQNLSITFKNQTSLKIEFMNLGFEFLYGEDRSNWHRVVVWNLDLGQVPSVSAETYFKRRGKKVPAGSGHPLEFGPGREMTISLSGGMPIASSKEFWLKPRSPQ